VLHRPTSLLPRGRDISDLRDWLLFNLGARAERPRMPHYNVNNKLEYWLTAIGLIILIVTGYMLWNPIATTNALPGEAIPVARVVHGEQALLMVILVVVWHGYTTLIRRLNGSIWTGRLSRRAMQEDHAEELARIDSGQPQAQVSAEERARRSRVFWPVAGLLTVVLLGLLYSFVTFEQTAITTIPRPEVPIFAPQVQPAQGDASVGAAIWQTVRCAICHGAQAAGGPDGEPPLRGTTLSFEKFYEQVRAGTERMPAFRQEELPDAYMLHLYTWLKAPASR
jgi:mono/diheme cytochrome c family protein